MKNQMVKRTLVATLVTAMAVMTLTGCGSQTVVSKAAESDAKETTIVEAEVPAVEIQEAVYNDANGWSVKYDPTKIEVVKEGTKVAFTYTGEGVGANSLLCYYDVDKTAKEARDEIAKGYGDGATSNDVVFPGTEDVPGYYASTAISAEGSGLYEQVFTRDYMDGYLAFEFVGHKSGDEEKDIEVSDVFAMIFDTISFNQ